MEVEIPTVQTRQVASEINDFKSSVSNEMWLTIGDETSEIVVKMDIQPETNPTDIFDSVGKVIQWRNAYVLTQKVVVCNSLASIASSYVISPPNTEHLLQAFKTA
jgi:hypothetical protein